MVPFDDRHTIELHVASVTELDSRSNCAPRAIRQFTRTGARSKLVPCRSEMCLVGFWIFSNATSTPNKRGWPVVEAASKTYRADTQFSVEKCPSYARQSPHSVNVPGHARFVSIFSRVGRAFT